MAFSINPAPKPSPHSRRAQPTSRRAFNPSFRQTCNSILQSTILSPASATPLLATIYSESAFYAASIRKRPCRWPKPNKFRAPPSTRLYQLLLLDTMCENTPNFAPFTTSIFNDSANFAQTYPGNLRNSHRRGDSKKSHNAHKTARSSSIYVAPLVNPLGALKPDMHLTPATTPLYAHHSNDTYLNQIGISACTRLKWTLSSHQLAPNTN